MSEEDLRIRQIRIKIPTLTFDEARKVSALCSEYYIEGLEQSRFDKRMLEEENDYLKLSCPEQNLEHFRILKENKKKIDKFRKQNKELKEANVEFVSKNNKLQHHIYSAIDYIDQVIGYKPVAREIDEELNTLIGILKGDYDE